MMDGTTRDLARIISDPGSVTPRDRESGESVATWGARALLASDAFRDLVTEAAGKLPVELDNHHNAAACPYCRGAKL